MVASAAVGDRVRFESNCRAVDPAASKSTWCAHARVLQAHPTTEMTHAPYVVVARNGYCSEPVWKEFEVAMMSTVVKAVCSAQHGNPRLQSSVT